MVGGRPLVVGNNGRTDASQTYYNCQAVGHMLYTCAEEYRRASSGNQGVNVLHIGISFTQSKTHESWVLLDTARLIQCVATVSTSQM